MKQKQIVKIGAFNTGKNNLITDVPGVLVGHYTINQKTTHTGLTVILPHNENLFLNKVVSSCYVYNGYGKSVGLVQVEELGTIETPIVLTNTLSVGQVSDCLISYMIEDTLNKGKIITSLNPLVLECNDSRINDIKIRPFTEKIVKKTILDASTMFEQGGVGAGTGMICHGFKGGIGSSSRLIMLDNKTFTIGVLVNTNFGSSNGEDLVFKNRPLGNLIKDYQLEKTEDQGSIIIVIATDLPLDSRQLKRLSKRAMLGVGRTGSYGGNGSGDIIVAFSTMNKPTDKIFEHILRINDNYLNLAFKAVVDATEEAILNSMLYAKTTKSYTNKEFKSLCEYKKLFEDLLEND